ncbi:hypothetical protein MERGE_001938 [Pneumocystis wakefieldiae]|uniref:Uncharacterized protein n=1 Tax=Pneumocystis wakefieldiae TaxID=38082 RepID=A0A899FW82_9ASCO|nr:hypothetical protein MERGE_001938 [Pneumocystis wakefieldiae]
MEGKKEADVFNILDELISEQKKKKLDISKQDYVFSRENSVGFKNDDLKKSTLYSPNFIVKPHADPSLIETYPSALRYIIQLTLWDPSILKKIKEMVQEQASYEEKWAKDRQMLIENLKNKQNANAFIRKDELLVFDLKIHRAIEEMSKVQEKELQRLGIPFFVNTKDKVNRENKKKVIQLLKDLVSE